MICKYSALAISNDLYIRRMTNDLRIQSLPLDRKMVIGSQQTTLFQIFHESFLDMKVIFKNINDIDDSFLRNLNWLTPNGPKWIFVHTVFFILSRGCFCL